MRLSTLLRIVLCGLVTGAVFTLLSIVLLGTLGQDFLLALSKSSIAGTHPKTGPALFFLSIAPGICVIWLYSIIRPAIASARQAGIVLGLAWWAIASLQSLKWVALLDIKPSAWLPLLLSAAAYISAAGIGAYLYGHVTTFREVVSKTEASK